MFNQYSRNSMSTINRQVRSLGNSSSNINNYFTTSYKSKQTRFYDTMHGIVSQETKNFSTGVPRKTDRELDFAIDGVGFFEVILPDGTYAYTRDGSFMLGPDGQLQSPQGYPISNTSTNNLEDTKISYEDIMAGKLDVGLKSESIIVPTGAGVVLQESGALESAEGEYLGKVALVAFPNVDGLQELGNGLYLPTERSGRPEEVKTGEMNGQTHLLQGYIESSNTNLVQDMNRIVEMNSSVKAQMKVIKLLDQMQEGLNSTITRNL